MESSFAAKQNSARTSVQEGIERYFAALNAERLNVNQPNYSETMYTKQGVVRQTICSVWGTGMNSKPAG